MTNPTDLTRELIDWAERHGYDPIFNVPDDPLNKVDYSRLLEGERQVDPERFGRGPAYSQADKKSEKKKSEKDDDESPGETCERCCKKWLVITVNREKKWINKSGGWAKTDYKLGGDGDWYVTTGTLKVELWSDERGSTKEVLLETGSVERGGPATLASGKGKMIPVGIYQLGGAHGDKHSTDSYNPVSNQKRLPGINIRGNGVGAGRGINIHSAGNWAYSIGCILPVPKERISTKHFVPKDRIGKTMSNLPPNWQGKMIQSHKQAIFIIDSLKNHDGIEKIGINDFKCAKIIITESKNMEIETIIVTTDAKGNQVASAE